MLKVMTIIGTRPEIIKMCRVISELEKYSNHILVHTGQNYDYELNQVFFDDLGLRKPDYFLNAAGKNVAQTIGNIIAKADEVMEVEKPDAILVYGDTNSCLSIISAKRRKIPVFHMEAGNRCFDQRVPEELNRKIVDHLSDINFVLTEHARRYLIAEGIRPETIFKTGSHLYEVLEYYKLQIQQSTALADIGLTKRNYFLVSMHREENVDDVDNLTSLLGSLNAIAKAYKLPVIVSTHPRTRARISQLENIEVNNQLLFLKPFGFFDYVKLQCEAKCVISDSGTITEESSILNFPAITIRNMHERPEGMDVGTLIMSGLDQQDILNSLRITLSIAKSSAEKVGLPPDYCNRNVSTQIIKSVQSYVGYVNRVVWKKT